ncbi:uncharacterized protein LOC135389854 [Ornithodoros turicata]|uniref:uncharacterized protein LOC135389854 n=1 Tax=Ornithodoros turicata TaxID=34597 RepID=UPI003139246D
MTQTATGFLSLAQKIPAPVDVSHRTEYVFVVTRHGERTPITRCSKLVKVNPEDYGQLTARGKEQCKYLGTWLKKRYSHLLTGQPGEVLATCNRQQRTFDSVTLALEGLGVTDVTPIRDPTDYDTLYNASLAGHYYVMMNFACIGQHKTLGRLVDFVVKNSGSPTQPQKAVVQAPDSLITHVSNGHPTPDWAQDDWHDILWADNRLFALALAGSEKALASYVMNLLLETLEVKFEKKQPRSDKMHLFMTSDVTLMPLIRLLHSSYQERPPFCSSVLVEVFVEKDEPRVHLAYCAGVNVATMSLDRLTNPCHLHHFTQELRRILRKE